MYVQRISWHQTKAGSSDHQLPSDYGTKMSAQELAVAGKILYTDSKSSGKPES